MEVLNARWSFIWDEIKKVKSDNFHVYGKDFPDLFNLHEIQSIYCI